MADIALTVHARENLGKGAARKVRRTGLIPGIIYGRLKDNLSVSVDPAALKKALVQGGGINTLLQLTIDGKDKKTTIVKEIQRDALQKHYIHVDFFELDLTQKVVVAVPLSFVGKAEGLKEGGIVQPIIREVKVRCFPNKIPSKIEIDVSHLNVGGSLHTSDIKATDDYEIAAETNEAIVTVSIPKEEVVATVAPIETAAPKEGEEKATPEAATKEPPKKEEKK